MIAEAGVSAPVPSAPKVTNPFEDRSKVWETMAALQYRADGVADGWDSDEPDTETPEQKYIKVWYPPRKHAGFNNAIKDWGAGHFRVLKPRGPCALLLCNVVHDVLEAS